MNSVDEIPRGLPDRMTEPYPRRKFRADTAVRADHFAGVEIPHQIPHVHNAEKYSS